MTCDDRSRVKKERPVKNVFGTPIGYLSMNSNATIRSGMGSTSALEAMSPDIDQTAIDTIRTLTIDVVQKANSGHPSAPMAAVAYTLWQGFLPYDPAAMKQIEQNTAS